MRCTKWKGSQEMQEKRRGTKVDFEKTQMEGNVGKGEPEKKKRKKRKFSL